MPSVAGRGVSWSISVLYYLWAQSPLYQFRFLFPHPGLVQQVLLLIPGELNLPGALQPAPGSAIQPQWIDLYRNWAHPPKSLRFKAGLVSWALLISEALRKPLKLLAPAISPISSLATRFSNTCWPFIHGYGQYTRITRPLPD